jgi:hypothetical protein
VFKTIESLPAGRLLTVIDVAERCGADPAVVREEWICAGVEILGRLVRLRAGRVGREYRIDPADLAAFIRECNPGASFGAAFDDEEP